MDWRHIRHVPVEDERGRLVGLVTHRDVLRMLARGLPGRGGAAVSVREIMKAEPLSVAPTTETLEAIRLMRERGVGCLPVVEGGALVGIVTAKDFLEASAKLFEERLTSGAPARRPEEGQAAAATPSQEESNKTSNSAAGKA
jgi:predicted transcriptional regulator